MPYRRPISPDPNLRWCSKCADFQPADQFAPRKAYHDGLDHYCRPHRAAQMRTYKPVPYKDYGRNTHLKCKYGISEAEYNAMLAAQGGVCAICQQPETATCKGKVRSLAVDHCHDSGRVRGLLCADCNRGIGILREDVSVLKAAIDYLERTCQ